MLAIPASAEFFSDVIVTSPNAIWTDSRAYSNLPAAIDAVGALQRTIVISSQQSVGNMTVPANVTLKFERDGAIINSGQLTFNTLNIIAEARQLFAGAGDIDFADGSVVKSSWFADLDRALDVTSDDTITLVITESETTDADMAVGDDVTLRWESPFIITVAAADTVSNIKNIEAGNYQIFAGAGDFDFLDGTRLKLSWFNSIRSVLSWVEAEEVTIIVSGSNTVNFTNTLDANEHLDLVSEQGSLILAAGVDLTVDGSINLGSGSILVNNGSTLTNNGLITITTGHIEITATGTLDFNSSSNISAPLDHQIFTGAGSTTGMFNIACDRYPEWWGVDGTTDETQVQAAIDAYAGGSVILSPDGYTFTTAGITLSSDDMYFGCRDARRTTITTAADIDAITVSARIEMENVRVYSSGASTKAGIKFIDGAKNGTYKGLWAQSFEYNYQFASTTATGIAYNGFYNIYGAVPGAWNIYMTEAGLGWVNENLFSGGTFLGELATLGHNATLVGNNNKFLGTSFEDANTTDFSIEETGSNVIIGCRFEMSCNGIRVNNASGNLMRGSRIYGNHWDVGRVMLAVTGGRCYTDTWAKQITFSGFIGGGSVGSTTVDAGSAAGQKVVNLTATTGFYVGSTIVLDEGNANEEWGTVDVVTAGVSITLKTNLVHTHAIAVTATSEGYARGVLGAPYGDSYRTQIWAYGQPVLDLSGETAGNPALSTEGRFHATQGIRSKYSISDTSNPPTDVQLDAAFGTPASVGSGFIAILDDAGAGANVYLIGSDGTNWWHIAITKAL